MSDDLIKILDGNTFVVSDRRGDIEATPADTTGLFTSDTRFLSRWVLTVNGTRTDRWLVTLDKGDVSVSRENVAADCVVRTDRALFDAMVSGDVNGMAAYLRGELTFEGDPEFLVLFQRVLPAPQARARSSKGRRQAQR